MDTSTKSDNHENYDLSGFPKVTPGKVLAQNEAEFAGPLPRERQIMRNLLLTSALSIFSIFVETIAIAINSNSNFRATFRNQSHGHEFEQQFELELLFLV